MHVKFWLIVKMERSLLESAWIEWAPMELAYSEWHHIRKKSVVEWKKNFKLLLFSCIDRCFQVHRSFQRLNFSKLHRKIHRNQNRNNRCSWNAGLLIIGDHFLTFFHKILNSHCKTKQIAIKRAILFKLSPCRSKNEPSILNSNGQSVLVVNLKHEFYFTSRLFEIPLETRTFYQRTGI